MPRSCPAVLVSLLWLPGLVALPQSRMSSSERPMSAELRALERLPVLRLTGAMLDEVQPLAATDFDTNAEHFMVDFDEWDEFVRLEDVRAALAAKPDAGEGLDVGPSEMELRIADENGELREQLFAAYADRNLVVQAFGRAMEDGSWPVAWGVDESEPDWPVLYIETPYGQVSWHIPKGERIYEPPDRSESYGPTVWDGHTNQQKADRLRAYLRATTDETGGGK